MAEEEDAKSTKEILAYKDKLAAVEKTLANFRRTNAKETENELAKQKKAIIDLWKAGELSNSQYQRALQKATRAQEVIQRAANDGSLGAMKQFGAKASSMMSSLSEKLGLDFASAGPIGIALWIAGLFDAQRTLKQWSQQTVAIFGDGGKDQGKTWAEAFNTPTKNMLANARFVTDEMRLSFSKAGLAMGTSIRGIGGEQYQRMMEDLLVTGQAFGITADEMAAKQFHFGDVLRFSTKEAGSQVLKTISLAKQLKVAPQQFLAMTTDLTGAFKLQNLSLGSVTETFEKFRKTAGLGRQATEELTRSTIQSLGTLSSSKIAGLLTIASGGGPQADLGESLVEFYKGTDKSFGGDRYKLLQAAFEEMKRRVPEAMENSFKGTQLTMSLAGVTDMATGVRLFELLKNADKTAEGSAKVADEARDMLEGQTSAQEQAINFLVNGMNMIVRLLTALVNRFSKDLVAKEIGEQYNKVSAIQARAMGMKEGKGLDTKEKFAAYRALTEQGKTEQAQLEKLMAGADMKRERMRNERAAAESFEASRSSVGISGSGAMSPGAWGDLFTVIKDAFSTPQQVNVSVDVAPGSGLAATAKAANRAESERGRK